MMLLPRFDRYGIALVSIIIIAFFLSTHFFYGPSPINGADNYLYAQLAYQLYQGHFNTVAQNGILAQQYLLLYGISAFYAIFGVSRLSEAGFGILSFLLTILVIYKIGKMLYNRNAGVISAAVFALNPIAIINSSYVGDNGPMALFVSLTVLFLVMGLRSKGGNKGYFALSGLFAVLGVLITSQVLELLPFLLLVLLAYLVKLRRKFLPNIGMFVVGAVLGFGVLTVFGLAGGNGALYIVTLNSSTYSSIQMPQVQVFQYLQWLFPYNMVQSLTNSLATLTAQHTFSGFSDMLRIYLDPNASNTYFSANESIGLYGYFTAAAIVFLICRWNMRMLIPLAWFISTFLYMGLGSVSLTHYVPINFAYARLMLIFIPAMALLIGFAFTDFLEQKRRFTGRYLSYITAILLVALLAANSIALANYVGLSQYNYIYPLLQISGFINMLPHGSTVLTDAPMGAYTGYAYNMLYPPTPSEGCKWIGAGSHLVLYDNAKIIGQCGLALEYVPSASPPSLSRYGLFNASSFGNLSRYRVYYSR